MSTATTDTTVSRTYAVPRRYANGAERAVFCHLRDAGVIMRSSSIRTTGTGGTDPDTGKPECLVQVRGDSHVHGAMLDRFAWMGW
jgi:hypothetical protein